MARYQQIDRSPVKNVDGPFTQIAFQKCNNAFGPSFWLIGIFHDNGVAWVAPRPTSNH